MAQRPYTGNRYLSRAVKAREYYAEQIARLAIEDFERLPEGTAKRRVREILSTFQRIGEIIQGAPSLDKSEWIHKATHPLVKEANRLERKLWRAFGSYQLIPHVVVDLWGKSPTWPPTAHLTFGVQLRSVGKEAKESRIIECLLESIKLNAMHKILTCSCGKLLFQRFSHQRFCSEKCRSKNYQDSQTWREYRRRKAREYYQLHKTGKVK